MIGGGGDDLYVVDNPGDVILEAEDDGVDTVNTSVSYLLSSNVENLTLTGNSSISGTGNALSNFITGNNGANQLDGAAGADSLVGGAGNDVYYVDNDGDQVIENASSGTDTVKASVSYGLPVNVEHLILTGTSDLNGTGNELANTMTGNSGVNILAGQAGNDTYVVDNVGDIVTELYDEGLDTVQAAIAYALGVNVENLTLTGTAAISGTGNSGDNVITGNGGNNILEGLGGADTLIGGSGADTASYASSAAGVTVSLMTGAASGGDATGEGVVRGDEAHVVAAKARKQCRLGHGTMSMFRGVHDQWAGLRLQTPTNQAERCRAFAGTQQRNEGRGRGGVLDGALPLGGKSHGVADPVRDGFLDLNEGRCRLPRQADHAQAA